jgi:putative ABC transport system permease protein
MTQNYLAVTARLFRKNRLHTIINIVCLSVGLTASLLTLMFIIDELSFDRFHAKGERIFRLNKVNMEADGSRSLTAESSGLMGPTMRDEFPEVENFVRYSPVSSKVVLTNGDKNVLLTEQELSFVDSSFFLVFDFRLLKGDPSTALRAPRSIVLTEKIARNLFGDEDPVGKTIKGFQDLDYEVTGIIAEPPRNSHLQFSALMSWTTTVPELGPLPFTFMNNWIAQAICTYVVLNDKSDQQKVESKLPKFMTDHIPTRVDKYSLYLQPFQDVYLKSYNVQALKMQRTGSDQFNNFFSIISGFILFLACVNYINISTSRATRRAREVAMRKTLGASRKQLVSQFMGESLVFVGCAALLAIVLLFLAVPYFNELTGKTLPLSLLANRTVIFGGLALVSIVTIASGLYPSFVLSAFAPATIQRSGAAKVTGNFARQTLIVFQFIITMCMISGTILIYQQIRLVLSADVGFDKEHVLLVNMTNDVMAKREILKDRLTTLPNVVSISASQTALGMGTYSTYVIPEGFNPDEIEARVFNADGNYQKTYGLEMAIGRFFGVGSSTDSASVIINETMMKKLKWSDPTSKTIKFTETSPALPVIGVLKDFHFKSFYEAVEPLVMVISPFNQRNLAIRFTGNPSSIISTLENQWKEIEGRYPFQYMFIDETFARAYVAEEKLLRTILTFAGLSIVIACLGLYGLVSFTIEQRTREFGIRKTLGASVAGLNYLVTRKFIALAFIASVAAVPLIITFIEKWLQRFALQIEVNYATFLLSFLILLAVTVITVSSQAIRAGLANPIDSLRHE